MASIKFSDYTDSPTIFFPSQPIQAFVPKPYSSLNQQNRLRKPIVPRRSRNFSQWAPATSSGIVMTNPSRKRSRDECSDEPLEPRPTQLSHNDVGSNLSHNAGSSMVDLTKSSPILAESEIGMSLDEKPNSVLLAKSEAISQIDNQVQETSAPKTKFQRCDTSSISEKQEALFSGSKDTLKSTPDDPVVDQFTHFLGIGWSRVSDDVGTQAAARGWARYIENHYPLSMVTLALKSKGLEAYLVESKEGYFLFSEDLNEARLVGSCWTTCMANLQQSPIAYQGTETLKASRTAPFQLNASTLSDINSSCLSPMNDTQTSTLHATQTEDIMIIV